MVRLLLKYFASARHTTMHVACCNGESRVVDMLRDYGIPTNVRDKDSNLPLHVACSARLAGKVQPSLRQIVTDQLTDVIRTLLKPSKKDVQKVGEDRKSPLSLACRHGSASMVRCLLENGAKVEPGLVTIACKRGDNDTLKVLLENNADLDKRNEVSGFSAVDSPLYIACEEGFEEVVETLIARGHRTDYKLKATQETLLHVSLLKANVNEKIVRQLLQTEEIDVDSVDYSGISPLRIACWKRLPNIMVLLLDAGASVDIPNLDGKTPLHLACGQLSSYPEGNKVLCNILEILLQRNSNPCKLAKNGECPLHVASSKAYRDRSGLERLLLHMAENNITTPGVEELSEREYDTRGLQKIVPPAATALHVACQYSCEGVMDRVLGDNVNTTDENGATPLLAAVKAKHHNVKIVRTLLENQAQVDSRDNQGVTVLQAYIDNTQRDCQVLELLLQHRVDLGQPDRKGNTLLHHADRLTDGEVDMIGASGLLTSDVVNAYNENGDTPLHIAFRAKCLKAAEMLVTAGALAKSENVRPEQNLAETQIPMHVACRDGHGSVVLELLDGGEQTESLCGRNRTPLHYASEGGHCVAVHYLLQHGARTETADNEGRTALHLACIGGHGSIATLLLKKGAEANACDHDGNTPLHLSAREGHTHVCLVLIHHGARLDKQRKADSSRSGE